METRAIVLTNGQINDPATIRSRLKDWGPAAVIAANGGSFHAESLRLQLHAVVGDLDSLTEDTKTILLEQGVDIQASPPEKDETDLELALLYAADHGATEIVVLGAFGGRVDMSVANLLLMIHPKLADIRIEMWFGSQTAWIIRPPGDEVRGQAGDTLSLIPLISDAEGVTTQNLAYPLNQGRLGVGPSRGLSNVLTDTTATIKLREGILLAVHTPGHA